MGAKKALTTAIDGDDEFVVSTSTATSSSSSLSSRNTQSSSSYDDSALIQIYDNEVDANDSSFLDGDHSALLQWLLTLHFFFNNMHAYRQMHKKVIINQSIQEFDLYKQQAC